MKLSNKILLGGFLLPIVATLIFVMFMSATSTKESEFQMGNNIDYQSNNLSF